MRNTPEGGIILKVLLTILNRTLEVLLSILLASMVFVALWAIFTRHFINMPATFTTEFLRYGLVWLSMLTAAYSFGKKGHLAIVVLKDRFTGKKLIAIDLLTELAIMFFAASVLIYGGIQGAMIGMTELSPTLDIPVGYFYLALPISGVYIILYSIINLIDIFREEKINQTEEPNTSTM